MKYSDLNEMIIKKYDFFADCFQFENIIHLPSIGIPLVHMLGAIISGSQVCIAASITNVHCFSFMLFPSYNQSFSGFWDILYFLS